MAVEERWQAHFRAVLASLHSGAGSPRESVFRFSIWWLAGTADDGFEPSRVASSATAPMGRRFPDSSRRGDPVWRLVAAAPQTSPQPRMYMT